MLFTKKQAVIIQIEAAIRAYDSGDDVCAITLAGAAEEAMPPKEETLFIFLKTMLAEGLRLIPPAVMKGSAKPGDILNYQRNWLKHHNDDEEPEMSFYQTELMIQRATSRFRAVYGASEETPQMKVFADKAAASLRKR